MDLFAGFEGFGYPKLAGFHNEVMLCSNDNLRRGELEYRVIIGTNCIYEISSETGYIRTLPPMVYKEQYVDHVIQVDRIERKTDRYIPELRKEQRIYVIPLYSNIMDYIVEQEMQ